MKNLNLPRVTEWEPSVITCNGAPSPSTRRQLGTLHLSADSNGRWNVSGLASGNVPCVDSRSETLRHAQRACEECAAEILAADLLRVFPDERLVSWRGPKRTHVLDALRDLTGTTPAPGPRYIVVPADQVTPEQEQHAEFFESEDQCIALAAKYNAGDKVALSDWRPVHYHRMPKDRFAVLDTRPEEVRRG